MIGAIAGDIIGSRFEHAPIKTMFFQLFHPACRFTDDTVLTVALAESLLCGTSFVEAMRAYYRVHPHAGYGGNFHRWARSERPEPYNSWGNGSAMRVSPVGFAFGTLEEVLDQARRSAEVTHDHPEGIKGAQAVAAAIFLARTGQGKDAIEAYLRGTFGYAFDEPLDSIREHYSFEVSCQHSVPQAITAFLDSRDYEDAVRKAVSLGGDADTQACIAGAIAHAFYGDVPRAIADEALNRLTPDLRAVTLEFCENHGCG